MKALEITQLSWLYQSQLPEITDTLAGETASINLENLNSHSAYLENVIMAGIEVQGFSVPLFKVFISNNIDGLFEIAQETIFRKDLIVTLSEHVVNDPQLLSEILAILVDQLHKY